MYFANGIRPALLEAVRKSRRRPFFAAIAFIPEGAARIPFLCIEPDYGLAKLP